VLRRPVGDEVEFTTVTRFEPRCRHIELVIEDEAG
jgi:hypothetical protein